MQYKKIIHDAWVTTVTNKPLIRTYAFLPALLTTLVGILYFTYQFLAFKTSYLFSGDGSNHGILGTLINKIVDFVKNDPSLGVTFAIVATIIVILYFFLPTICLGALVELIARKRNGQEVKLVDGVRYGILSFLPLLEYHLFVKTFSIVGLLIEASFAVRNLGMDAFRFLVIPFSLIGIVGLFLTLLFTYTDFFIIIDKEKVVKSIWKSCKLVVYNWQHTFLMLILMMFISLRIILNIVIVLAIPILILLPTAYIASVTYTNIALVLGGILGLVGLYFAAYFSAVLEVFATSVWTFTFLEITEEGEQSARDKSASARDHAANKNLEIPGGEAAEPDSFENK